MTDPIFIEPSIKSNHLFYGDNLTIMRSLPAGSVDLIYLDPPFKKKLTGQPVPEQEEAFCDAWELDPEKEEMARRMPVIFREYGADEDLIQFWQAWISALRHTQPRLLAYLVYMSYRLFEMRRILKSTGALYLHCDPTASHYIKVILDGIFGHQNFRSEIVWKRTHAHGGAKRPGAVHDVLLFYTKSDKYIWNKQMEGADLQDMWTDIPPISAQAKERLGYPTQKPIALLKRIISESTNEGDVVFDPFCGGGTAVYAAHLTGRKWIGCDIAILSVRLIRDVLLKRYGLKEGEHYSGWAIPAPLGVPLGVPPCLG